MNKFAFIHKIVFLTCLIYAQIDILNGASVVGHSHHNKRQQPGLTPSLNLDVGPHSVIQPSTAPKREIPEYYFNTGAKLFNFTCTIKHPSFRYKLSITREQIYNNGEKSAPLELLDQNDYILNSHIKDSNRMRIEYSEPNYLDPNARHLRISLIITDLSLEDNGIYTCKYANLAEKIKAVVYKQLTHESITLNAGNQDGLFLDVPLTITCIVKDVYPKPNITFSHSNRNDLSGSITEKDVSNSPKAHHIHAYSIISTLNLVPKYTDHNQALNCTVSSHTSQVTTLFKSLPLVVKGTQIIESECANLQIGQPGQQDVEITCVFFSNPKQSPIQWEIKTNQGDSDSFTEQTPAAASETNQQGTVNKETETFKISEDDEEDESSNYRAYVRPFGEPNSGLYQAVLKIKEVHEKDLKEYIFHVAGQEKVIKLDKENAAKKDLSIDASQSSSSALFSFHSKVLIAISNMILFALVRLF